MCIHATAAVVPVIACIVIAFIRLTPTPMYHLALFFLHTAVVVDMNTAVYLTCTRARANSSHPTRCLFVRKIEKSLLLL